ncbi:MAG TPA: glycerate kinase [Dongiaceae bacterium]|nr:glycerate kinase [Dongiaceae bacterium]
MKVLITPDKFKGTLTAAAAAAAIARGWRRVRPGDQLELLPQSDGGDGFGAVMGDLLGAQKQVLATVDAAHRPCRANWWWQPQSRMAIIEAAQIGGLARLPSGKFHPFDLDTFGLGAAVRAAVELGARHLVFGIGGSATNDGGFGLARALDWNFGDRSGRPIEQWRDLADLAVMTPPRRRRWGRITVGVDVQNRLLGVHGCTRVYGPQKGLRPEDFMPAERALRRLALVARRQFGRDFAAEPGAGAAGGLGFGLRVFLGAQLVPGFDLFARQARLNARLREVDLVLTGEGAIDRSTLMGKGVGQTALRCRQAGVPCVGLAGVILLPPNPRRVFHQTRALTELTTPQQARARAGYWLERLAAVTAAEISVP